MKRRRFFKSAVVGAAAVATNPKILEPKPALNLEQFFALAYELKKHQEAERKALGIPEGYMLIGVGPNWMREQLQGARR